MRITRSVNYKFRVQDYEGMELMASITVGPEDLGIPPERWVELDDEQIEERVKEMENYCGELLERQLEPLLSEADEICNRDSSAHDVHDYHEGRRRK